MTWAQLFSDHFADIKQMFAIGVLVLLLMKYL